MAMALQSAKLPFCALDSPSKCSSFRSTFLSSPLSHSSPFLKSSFSSLSPYSNVSRWYMSLHARRNKVTLQPFQDKFQPWLEHAARSEEGQDQLSDLRKGKFDGPPLLDIATRNLSEWTMTAPAQVERGGGYDEHKSRRPPPDLPSLMLNSRIVYIGMPLVPAVTELIIAELLYLQHQDPRQPAFVYINSTGTSRADGETVGMETEGFAIYDTMMLVKNEIQTVAVGAAIGQACLLLSAGEKDRRYMMPHATAMIQQPRVPSMGQMSAIDIQIRAREVINNRDTLVRLLAKHTGNSFEVVAKKMERPFYMSPTKAIEFGVADKILWRGQEAMADTLSEEGWDKRAGIRVVERPSS